MRRNLSSHTLVAPTARDDYKCDSILIIFLSINPLTHSFDTLNIDAWLTPKFRPCIIDFDICHFSKQETNIVLTWFQTPKLILLTQPWCFQTENDTSQRKDKKTLKGMSLFDINWAMVFHSITAISLALSFGLNLLCMILNKANLRDLIAATVLVILLKLDSNRQFFARVTLKFDGWPRKLIWHVLYTTSSLVYNFIFISEFKLELQAGNVQSGPN